LETKKALLEITRVRITNPKLPNTSICTPNISLTFTSVLLHFNLLCQSKTHLKLNGGRRRTAAQISKQNERCRRISRKKGISPPAGLWPFPCSSGNASGKVSARPAKTHHGTQSPAPVRHHLLPRGPDTDSALRLNKTATVLATSTPVHIPASDHHSLAASPRPSTTTPDLGPHMRTSGQLGYL
jgi:hypothetical protein